MDRLKGKNTIITGAAGGQGKVACRMFAAEGARVFASDIVADAAAEIEALAPGAITYLAADVTRPEGIRAIVDGATRAFGGRIDVLYNNHGVILGKPFLETTPEEWDRVHNVDLKSVYFLSQRAVPAMPAGSSIINISSVGGLLAMQNMSAYSAAKGGVAMLTRGMALDLSPRKIRVNAIAPGAIDTPMPHNFLKDLPDKEGIWNAIEERHMMRRFGQPHEVVTMAIFLASDESSFMTGSVVAVDGGWSAF
ncbi:MAG TPA: SDR family oxidoreductase [Candidatus Binataceae bacterium]|nr:SDR family oxidoreductase [Candidatus Binataceae bacterium]